MFAIVFSCLCVVSLWPILSTQCLICYKLCLISRIWRLQIYCSIFVRQICLFKSYLALSGFAIDKQTRVFFENIFRKFILTCTFYSMHCSMLPLLLQIKLLSSSVGRLVAALGIILCGEHCWARLLGSCCFCVLLYNEPISWFHIKCIIIFHCNIVVPCASLFLFYLFLGCLLLERTIFAADLSCAFSFYFAFFLSL